MRQVIFSDEDKVEWLDQRFYKVKDKEIYLPSVTTILEAYPKPPALFEWLKKNGENSDSIRDAAADVGSTVHQAIESYDNGTEICWADDNGKEQFSLSEWQMICKYVEFSERTKYELICNEISLVSEKLGYGGTIDKVCKINGKTYLIDNKTSNAVYDNHWLQLTAYKALWDEFYPEHPIDFLAILHLKATTRTDGKNGAIQGKGWKLCLPEESHSYYQNLFGATRILWDAQNPDCKPLNKVYPAKLQKQIL